MSRDKPSQMSSSGSHQRLARIDEILFAHVQRRNQGEDVSDEELLRAHPELMPELKEQLELLSEISDTQQREDSTPGSLNVRCPNCRQTVSVSSDSSVTDITCSSCGSRFSLDVPETQGYGQRKRLGHFELIEQVGAGSFGSVWKARDTQLDRIVAVKIPRQGRLNPDELEQFVREARAAAQLKHPNIVSVHEVGREEKTVYIVGDFVEGVTLADWLTTQKPAFRESALLCAKIATALEHAHQAGVIHRDLKPQNIMLDADGEPHLMDFGLARRDVGEVTMTMEGRVLGTPAYMSPEQARGEAHQADRRTDVYSLGVILFELLTGELPFRGNARMLIHQVINEDAPSPRKLNGSVPRDLETICLKCLEKEPARRIRSADIVADELRRFLAGHPIQSRPISSAHGAARWCRRNPFVAAVVLLVGFLAVAGPLVAVNRANLLLSERAARLDARRQGYSTAMQLAAEALEERNLMRARHLLQQMLPAHPDDVDLRGWEWRYYWQMSRGDELATLTEHDQEVLDVAFSPDDRFIASASRDGIVRVLRGNSQQVVWQRRFPGIVGSLSFSFHGNLLALGCSDGFVHVWNVESRQEVWRVRTTEAGAVDPNTDDVEVVFSPLEEHVLAFSGRNHVIHVCEVGNANPLATFNAADDRHRVQCLAFSPDGRYLASGFNAPRGILPKAIVWDRSGNHLPMQYFAPFENAGSVAFSPDGRRLAASHYHGEVAVWDLSSPTKPICTFSNHRGTVSEVVFHSNGDAIVSAGQDRTIRRWKVESSAQEEVLLGHDDRVMCLAISADGKSLISGSRDGQVKLWSFSDNRQRVRRMEFGPDAGLIHNVSPGGDVFLVRKGQQLQIWDTLRLERKGHGYPVKRTPFVHAVANSGNQLAVGYRDGEIRLVQIDEVGAPVRDDGLLGHQTDIARLAFSHSGGVLVSLDTNGHIRVWDLGEKQPIYTLDGPRVSPFHLDQVLSLSYDERYLASCGVDGVVKVWDFSQSPPEERSLLGHKAWVKNCSFSPDSRTLVTVGYDGQVLQWDLVARSLPRRFGLVDNYASFSQHARRVVTPMTFEGTIKLWDANTQQQVATLPGASSGVNQLRAFFLDDDTLVCLSQHEIVQYQPPSRAEIDRTEVRRRGLK